MLSQIWSFTPAKADLLDLTENAGKAMRLNIRDSKMSTPNVT